ncbi:MAG TPA: hypothetical protein VGN72_21710 [Tepidisphaeraceae bacterium]|jgi:hypothetical protein|nr:hypothetical protein [Tepidisphaeraceae bacterium]
MSSESSYADQRRRVCEAAAARGYEDPASLRELLICTTSTTAPMAEAYFAERRNDPKLLSLLVAIALEGEDAGDAPWAAANTIADFPAEMLLPHKSSLETLAAEQWSYLHVPGRQALEKIAAAGGAR